MFCFFKLSDWNNLLFNKILFTKLCCSASQSLYSGINYMRKTENYFLNKCWNANGYLIIEQYLYHLYSIKTVDFLSDKITKTYPIVHWHTVNTVSLILFIISFFSTTSNDPNSQRKISGVESKSLSSRSFPPRWRTIPVWFVTIHQSGLSSQLSSYSSYFPCPAANLAWHQLVKWLHLHLQPTL